MFLFQIIATFMFFIIALIPPLIIVAPFWICRGALMNSTNPLKQGIVMDLVPKKERGKFSSLDFLAFNLVFSITAGIGGILLDNYNFKVLFLTTTIIYVIGTTPILLIRRYVQN